MIDDSIFVGNTSKVPDNKLYTIKITGNPDG